MTDELDCCHRATSRLYRQWPLNLGGDWPESCRRKRPWAKTWLCDSPTRLPCGHVWTQRPCAP